MPSCAENTARLRLANNGRNAMNDNQGIRTGSHLHLCEMLLADLDVMRKALTEICVIRAADTPQGLWRIELQEIARKAIEAVDRQ